MESVLSTLEAVGVCVEAVALVGIFIWDRIDASQQHKQTLAQMEIMQNQARATETAANAANRSAEIAEMALKLAERADVLLNAVSLTTNVAGVPTNRPINPYGAVTMEFKNFGRTRAENVRCDIGLVIPGVPKSVPQREPFILGPGATQCLTFQTFKETLTQETFEQIANGTINLRFAGNVSYDDVFGESHSYVCRGILNPETGTFIVGEDDPRKDLRVV